LFGHVALDFVGASHSVDHAGEFNKSAIPGILYDASAMISDFGIEKPLSESLQLGQRAFSKCEELNVSKSGLQCPGERTS
jgi:hypothetical protein